MPSTAAAPPTTTSKPSHRFSILSLRRHQISSLEPSTEAELHLLDLLHSNLTHSLQSLLPLSKTLTLTLPFLHKLLDTLLISESDFKSLLFLTLSRNPNLLPLHPPLHRAISDLLDRFIKTLDLCNSVSLALHSLHLWNRHADIAVSALRRHGSAVPRQINRGRRALSKLLSDAGAGLTKSFSSSCCRFCSSKRHLQIVASGFTPPRGADSGSAATLAVAVYTVTALLQFCLWVMVVSFQCGRGEVMIPMMLPMSVGRNMAWAAALERLSEKIVEEMKRGRKERGGYGVLAAGMVAEAVEVGRSGREVLKLVEKGDDEMEVEIMNLEIASEKLEEGLGLLERKMREVFHRLLICREDVLRCLSSNT